MPRERVEPPGAGLELAVVAAGAAAVVAGMVTAGGAWLSARFSGGRVGGGLAGLEPRLFQFLLGFAGDNELVVARVAGALASPQTLSLPGPAPRGEPREPV